VPHFGCPLDSWQPGAAPPPVDCRALTGCALIRLPKTDSKLLVLITTACVDMMGTLIIVPLLPFYATRMGANGFIYTTLVSAFSVATLASAPLWGRFSDRYGRRPALLIALGASAISYVVFAYANSLGMLLLSRIIQGAGGGTVGVVQAYVADATEPKDRARALGWLSAATNVGVAVGPLLSSVAIMLGTIQVHVGRYDVTAGHHAPGLLAAVICAANMYFAWRYLRESHVVARTTAGHVRGAPRSLRVIWRVIGHTDEPASRLIWIYAVGIGAYMSAMAIIALFLARQFGVTDKTIGYFFTYFAVMNIIARAAFLGPLLDRLGEPRLSRIGTVLLALGLILIPLAHSIGPLLAATALIPLGASFTFPCVTAMLSRVISPDDRGLYMGTQQTFGGVTRAVFPLGAGILWDHFGPGVPFWAAGVLVAGTLLLGLNLESYMGSQPDAPSPASAELGSTTPAPVAAAAGSD
jgi:MFS family permease